MKVDLAAKFSASFSHYLLQGPPGLYTLPPPGSWAVLSYIIQPILLPAIFVSLHLLAAAPGPPLFPLSFLLPPPAWPSSVWSFSCWTFQDAPAPGYAFPFNCNKVSPPLYPRAVMVFSFFLFFIWNLRLKSRYGSILPLWRKCQEDE